MCSSNRESTPLQYVCITGMVEMSPKNYPIGGVETCLQVEPQAYHNSKKIRRTNVSIKVNTYGKLLKCRQESGNTLSLMMTTLLVNSTKDERLTRSLPHRTVWPHSPGIAPAKYGCEPD
jgi:hypothetical protein